MFERFTEKARRVIFFARYEASAYGSEVIEPEHLLLGLTREDDTMVKSLCSESAFGEKIRHEVEAHVTRRPRISVSVEVPVSTSSKKILHRAVAAANNLEHRTIGTEHLLIGLLQEDNTLAAKILRAHGVELEALTARLTKIPRSQTAEDARRVVEAFLSGLKQSESGEMLCLFADNARVVDADGKHWTGEELKTGFESVFATYAKRNASYQIEAKSLGTQEMRSVSVVWKNALLASEQRAWADRMTVHLEYRDERWQIMLVQINRVDPARDQQGVKSR